MADRQRSHGTYDKGPRAASGLPEAPVSVPKEGAFFTRHPRLGFVFHCLMVGILGAMAFGIGGALAILMLPRRAKAALDDRTAWIVFIGGGIFAVTWLSVTYFRKIKRSAI